MRPASRAAGVGAQPEDLRLGVLVGRDELELTGALGSRVAEQLQAFKVGINRPRSRGDREEVFGGMGESWKGAFVGGDLLVQAVTYGPDGDDERLFGNFPDYSQFPSR